jgi:hypothetical protein
MQNRQRRRKLSCPTISVGSALFWLPASGTIAVIGNLESGNGHHLPAGRSPDTSAGSDIRQVDHLLCLDAIGLLTRLRGTLKSCTIRLALALAA